MIVYHTAHMILYHTAHMIVYHTAHMDKQRRANAYWQTNKYSPRNIHNLQLQRSKRQAGSNRFV